MALSRLAYVLLTLVVACADGEEVDGDPWKTVATVDGGSVGQEGLLGLGVRWTGRVLVQDSGVRLAWSGSGLIARFRGTALAVRLRNDIDDVLLLPIVDGEPASVMRTGRTEQDYPVVEGLEHGEHVVELARQTEGQRGATQIVSLTTDGELLAPPPMRARRLEVVGDSISTGGGALGQLGDADCFATQSHWHSFAAQLARMLDAELTTIAVSGIGVSRNYGGDAEFTMRELYPRTLPHEPALWSERFAPDAVVINLGTNDINGDKGDPGVAFEQRYLDLLRELRTRYPAALIVGTIGPMLSGAALTTIQARIGAAVSAFHDANALFYDGIETQTADKFACAYHPNPAEHALIARDLAELLADRLDWH